MVYEIEYSWGIQVNLDSQGEEWKTAFRTCYGLFKSLIMPVSLTNTVATFQNYINDVLVPYLDHFCTTSLDDTLIYSDNFQDYRQHVHLLLVALAKVGPHLKPKKCQFHQQQVKYLGTIMSTEGIKMDSGKICTMQVLEPPGNLKDVNTLLGFANFYIHFNCNYSRIIQLLTFFTCKGVPFA
jgi:hypothetical protein